MLICLRRNLSILFAVLLYCALPCQANPPFTQCPDKTVIFVNNACSDPGDGSYATPYNDLTVALAASNPCDVIYVFPGNANYVSATFFQLKDNQRLLGTTTQAFECAGNCAKPTLSSSTNVLQLAMNNEVSGFNFVGPLIGIVSELMVDEGNNALITNNTFNTQTGVFLSLPSLGNLTISNCQFNAEMVGVELVGCGNGNVQINNNFFSSNGGGKPNSGILIQSSASPLSLSILNNTLAVVNNLDFRTPIYILNDQPGVSLTGTLLLNNITIGNGASTNAGIWVENDAAAGPICLNLSENFVSSPPDVPGYLLWNSAGDGLFQFHDNINLGTIETNVATTNSGPPSLPTFPITYIKACP